MVDRLLRPHATARADGALLAVVAVVTAIFALGHLAAGTLTDHLSPPPELLAAALRIILLGSFMGAASGALFWLIAVSGRGEAGRPVRHSVLL